jgi:hypothetical protein
MWIISWKWIYKLPINGCMLQIKIYPFLYKKGSERRFSRALKHPDKSPVGEVDLELSLSREEYLQRATNLYFESEMTDDKQRYCTYLVDMYGEPLNTSWVLGDRRKSIGIAIIRRKEIPQGK